MRKYFELIRKFLKIKKENNLAAILVAFPGQEVMFLARFLTRKPIIFDAFTSHYGGYILDRKYYSKKSPQAHYYRFLDKWSCRLADLVLLDTQAHIDFFIKEFDLPRKKFRKVFVGTDPSVFYPKETSKNDRFNVHFHGNYIPLQGVEYIIKAAKIVEKEEIHFNLIGRGQTYSKCRKLAEKLNVDNVDFIDFVPYEILPDYINKTDISLGIFGDTPKTDLVIPNKVFEAIACAKPVITASTPAIKEIFEHGKNCWLVPAADPEALVEAIVYLRDNHDVREKIAGGGYELYNDKFTPIVIGKRLEEIIQEIWKQKNKTR